MTATLYLVEDIDTAFQHAVQRIREVQEGDTLQEVSILVPTSHAVKAVGSLLGETMGVSITQFYGLGQAVLDTAGLPVYWLSDTSINRLIRHLLEQMAVQDELTSFMPVWEMPGFQQALMAWLREMKSQGIFPEEFSNYAAVTNLERDRQLSTLYNRYQIFLQENLMSDSDGLLWLAAEVMKNDPELFRMNGIFLILGFDQFNPIQERMLFELTKRVRSFGIYLPWDPNRSESSLALSRLAETRTQLQRALPNLAEIVLAAVNRDKQVLADLRRTLFEVSNGDLPELVDWSEDDPVHLWEAPSREMEVRLALREIKHLLLQGVPADEIALLAPQPEVYRRLVELTAEEYGVFFELDHPLVGNPAIQALLNLLELPFEFPWRQTLDSLRCPYFRQDWLSSAEIGLLEDLSRERPVIKGREQWFFALEPAQAVHPETLEDEDLGPLRLVQSLPPDQLLCIHQKLEAYFDLLTPPQEATHREYVLWLQDTILGIAQPVEDDTEPDAPALVSLDMQACIMQTCNMQACIEQVGNNSSDALVERDLTALKILLQHLRMLVEAQELVHLGEAGQCLWVDFRKELEEMLSGLMIPADPLASAVRFDHLEVVRGKPLDYLFILGLSEGEFPSQPALDPFYAPQERLQTSLLLRKLQPAAQASLWWLAVSGCRQTLTLLRPYIDENGAPWEPSPYWDAVQEKVHLRARRIPVAAVPDVSQAASLPELTVALALQQARIVPSELEQAWKAAQHSYSVMQKRQAWTPAPAFEGFLQAADLQAELSARYSERYTWSATRLNQYGMCPFGFFASSVLNLEERTDPVEGFDPMQRGSLLHAVLERLHSKMHAVGLFMALSNQDAVLELLEQVCRQVFARAPQRYGFRPGAVWRYEQDELRRLLNALVLWECEQASDFHPYKQELRFGISGSELPRFRFTDSLGTVFYLHGVVDRVDRDETQGILRVLDYKSGSTAYNNPDLEAGRALQTPLYALAVEGLLQEQVRESAYILIPARVLSGTLKTQASMAENETAQIALEQAGKFIRDIQRGVFPSLPSKPTAGSMTCSAYCSFAGLCRIDRQAAAKARRVVV